MAGEEWCHKGSRRFLVRSDAGGVALVWHCDRCGVNGYYLLKGPGIWPGQ